MCAVFTMTLSSDISASHVKQCHYHKNCELTSFDRLKFYHKDYKYVGKLVGRFYDADGQVTEYWKKLQVWRYLWRF